MSQPLWTLDELVTATGGTPDGEQNAGPVSGISIDTRTIETGDLFVALKDVRDGHEFVPAAFGKGAAVALVNKGYEKNPDDGALLRVEDPLQALEKLAIAARVRLGDTARVVAVTGSAGKTTTKEMLRLSLAHLGRVHASEKSYNNHWGVPLTLARMPRETDFAVIEIGMNHAGEIRPLTKMARPHVAVVTSVLPVHLEHFSGIEEIAEAKAEIFEGLDTDGHAVIPCDGPQYELLARRACEAMGLNFEEAENNIPWFVHSFGEQPEADHIAERIELSLDSSKAFLTGIIENPVEYKVGVAGRHNVLNAAACLVSWFSAIEGLKLTRNSEEALPGLEGVLQALANMKIEPVGRGQVFELENPDIGNFTLIDESYNANPASMRAALENLSLYPPGRRKVAVIGDMLELGKSADELHIALGEPIKRAGIDAVFACGGHMKQLYEALPQGLRAGYEVDAEQLKPRLLAGIRAGDIVMIKGSNGSKLASLVEALKIDHSPEDRAGSR